jgi:hypothetical protein
MHVVRGKLDGGLARGVHAPRAARNVRIAALGRRDRAFCEPDATPKTSLRICDTRPLESAKNDDHLTTKISVHHGLVRALQGY